MNRVIDRIAFTRSGQIAAGLFELLLALVAIGLLRYARRLSTTPSQS